MKSIFKFLLLASVAMVGAVSCSDDELGESIFDTTERPLDRTVYCFPLDSFVKREFLEPYNLRFIYRMEDLGSDMDKNLVPAPYDKSVQLAALSKYLWYDVYKTLAGEKEVFLKRYSPRILHIIGSKSYNPTQGTETLGVAEGGIKITLTNVNNLDVNDIAMMNEYFFKTMHHEFSHILDQTKIRPSAFNLLSTGKYDAIGWSDTPDSVAFGRGFVSPYASSAVGEDWVENIACYVTTDSISWSLMLEAASYDWELIDVEDETAYWKMSAGANLDTVGYYHASQSGEGNKIYRRLYKRDGNDCIILGENGKPQPVDADGYNGRDLIERKVDFCRTYLMENYQIDIDQLRAMVQDRMYVKNAQGYWARDAHGRLVNKLTSRTASGVTLIDSLTNEIYSLKGAQ